MKIKSTAYVLTLLATALIAASSQALVASQKPASFEVALPGRPFGVVASSDNQWIFVSILDQGIAVLRNMDGHIQIARTIRTQSPPAGLVLTHDGNMLIAAAGNSVVCFDTKRLETGEGDPVFQSLSDASHAGSVYVNLTGDDKTLFVSNEGDQSITVIDLDKIRTPGLGPAANLKSINPPGKAADAIIGRIPVGISPIALTFSKDEKWLFTTSEVAPPNWKWPPALAREGAPRGGATEPEGAVVVIDVTKAKTDPKDSVVARVPGGGSPVRSTLSPDGSRLFVTARNSNALMVFNTTELIKNHDQARPTKIPVGPSPVPLVLVMDGKLALIGNSNRFSANAAKSSIITVLDTSCIGTDRDPKLGEIPCGAFPREFHLSADGKTLFLTNCRSDTLQVIDAGRLMEILRK